MKSYPLAILLKTITFLCLPSVTCFSNLPYSPNALPTSFRVHGTILHSANVDTSISKDENLDPRLVGLSLQLNDGTRTSHSIAENSAFVTGFFKGLSTRESYSKLLNSMYHVYDAMENAFEHTTEDTVKQMDYSALRRVDALKKDMEYFYGSNWGEEIIPSVATKKYVNRIKYVAENEPKLLIAHQYSRYLGDLFGGQMMSNMATKSLNLDGDYGVSFYKFDDIASTKDFITAWYSKLNELNFSEKEKQDIVDEANLVFALNIEIFEELEGSAIKSLFTFAWQSFRETLGLSKNIADS